MLKKTDLQKIRKAAVEASHLAGDYSLKYFRKKLDVHEKARSSLVTKVDINCEALIKKHLQKKFPEFYFHGEESGANNSFDTDTPMWHVDPLDGTTNFVHGFPMYCVSIGLAIRDEPIVGVIHIPTMNETFHGAKSCGAKLNNKAIHVSKRTDLSQSLLTTGFAYLKEEENLAPEIHRFQKAHLEARAIRRPGAAALDLAYVSAGIFDGFWEKNLASWDICAGALLVQEAGGKVSDYSGKKFTLHSKELLASNGLIHKKMIDIL